MAKLPCYCEHAESSHRYGICRTCARWEQRKPQFNWSPRHFYAVERPYHLEMTAEQKFNAIMEIQFGGSEKFGNG